MRILGEMEQGDSLILGNSRGNPDREVLKIVQCLQKRDCALKDVFRSTCVSSSTSYHKVYIGRGHTGLDGESLN
jgi:hypothetical protein